ncbi:hypothetical protein A3H22_03715 [Candidatus Peribacteria bacterium RIFCSPLOWO2_12_FULL_55_15]|nr:MAG: hypothetical protein A2789_03595 [Candidatus Peribacteria bacterium RIFCSPHIGHO2_01_FULL_54_22]OGJ69024.1 MAG: hypothetical protein A3H90_03920 [Candidatus Peribacteria bacterium RIFCSPLOWO2_02_FULL_55_36]OGJ71817.1 MAG: hypothetical protein A3H22_03715 [Candidatus Peribacteria bacterium RIFCSPLOWO2_12_FULL_55_15]
MAVASFHLTATKQYIGLSLRRLIEGPVGWVVFLALLWKPVRHFMERGDMDPLGVSVVLLVSFLCIIHNFLKTKFENDSATPFNRTNLAGMLSVCMVRALRHRRNPSAHQFLVASLRSERARFILQEIGLNAAEILQQHQSSQEPFDLILWMQEAVIEASAFGEERVDANIVFLLLFRKEPLLQALLDRADIAMKDLENTVHWEVFHNRTIHKPHSLSPQSLVRAVGTIGRSWVMGYTHDLDRITTDISEHLRSRRTPIVVLNTPEIETIQRVIYRSTQHNILVLGKVGAGKRTLVENFARKLRQDERRNNIPFTRVLWLRTELLLSGTTNPDAFLLNALAHAQRAGHFILVLPDVGALFRAANANLKAVVVQFLQAKNVNVLGIVDAQDYHTIIKAEPTVDSLFEKIAVEEATEEETMSVLMEQYFSIERKGVAVTYKAFKTIVELSQRYIGKGAFPGKAVEVLEDAILAAVRQGEKCITEQHVREVISLKAHMNVQKVTEGEREKLLELEDALKGKIVGQEEAIHALANALKRGRLDVGVRKRPIGTFLFLGPTGVGKTETAKVLAEIYFGSVDRIVRIDMNEFVTEESVYEIIGSPDPGKQHAEGFLTKKIQDQPFSLVLLDEIEKAHPKVLNLFLQILDEGQLMDGLGVKTDFRNTIIIATSNAGALFIRDFFKAQENAPEQHPQFRQQLIDEILKQKLFSPEFMNRFDDIILYFPLTREQALQLAILMLDGFIRDFSEKKGINIVLEEEGVAALAEKGYSIEFGAREMRRVIMEKLETYLANYLLKNTVHRGETITVRKADLEL